VEIKIIPQKEIRKHLYSMEFLSNDEGDLSQSIEQIVSLHSPLPEKNETFPDENINQHQLP